MCAASVRPRSASDCHICSAVDIFHSCQQGNPRAGSSVTNDSVRAVIINGLGAGAVERGGNTSLSPGRATDTVPSSVVFASLPLSLGRGLYLPTQSQASYCSAYTCAPPYTFVLHFCPTLHFCRALPLCPALHCCPAPHFCPTLLPRPTLVPHPLPRPTL